MSARVEVRSGETGVASWRRWSMRVTVLVLILLFGWVVLDRVLAKERVVEGTVSALSAQKRQTFQPGALIDGYEIQLAEFPEEEFWVSGDRVEKLEPPLALGRKVRIRGIDSMLTQLGNGIEAVD